MNPKATSRQAPAIASEAMSNIRSSFQPVRRPP